MFGLLIKKDRTPAMHLVLPRRDEGAEDNTEWENRSKKLLRVTFPTTRC